ncbi:MAG: type II toxin-antitoxin system RelE/ParE family toxin [Sedimenticola sp.]
MIKSFKHEGLEKFYTAGTKKGIQAAYATSLRMQLAALDTAHCIEDLDVPGYRLHKLTGNKKGLWSITVSGNWRITFEFQEGHVYIVNYEDYH